MNPLQLCLVAKEVACQLCFETRFRLSLCPGAGPDDNAEIGVLDFVAALVMIVSLTQTFYSRGCARDSPGSVRRHCCRRSPLSGWAPRD